MKHEDRLAVTVEKMRWLKLPGMARSAGVSVTPAWITFVRTPKGASSTARERATDSSAHLAAPTAA